MHNSNAANVAYRQSPIYFLNLAHRKKKSNPLYFPADCHTFRKVWLKLYENSGSNSFKNLTQEILPSAPNDPQNELNQI